MDDIDVREFIEKIDGYEGKLSAINDALNKLGDSNSIFQEDISSPFDLINLPSQGIFYKNKKDSLVVRYLTAIEENLLCNEMLMSSGKGIQFVLNRVIVDNDIQIESLLLSDFQAILMFLRSTAYGDRIETSFDCSNCSRKNEINIFLSQLDFRENESSPDDNGEFSVSLPLSNLNIKTTPLTLGSQIYVNLQPKDTLEIYDEERGSISIERSSTSRLSSFVSEINNIRDKEKIKSVVRKIPKRDSIVLKEFIDSNEVGVKNVFLNECVFCGHESQHKMEIGYNFLNLPSEHKNTVLEEIFLITYYGKGVTRGDALSMPVFERRWHINRIKEEMEKKKRAEENAMKEVKTKTHRPASGHLKPRR